MTIACNKGRGGFILTILLVEDDENISFTLERFLQQKGAQAICCGTVEEARAALTPAISIALLDLNLPDGNGYDLCRTIKTMGNIPVIFLTVRDEEKDIVKGLDMGAADGAHCLSGGGCLWQGDGPCADGG